MTDEMPIVAPVYHHPVEIVMPPVETAPLPVEVIAMPTPEQGRAVEAAFTQQQQQESHLAAGLLGMWSGTLLLHDLAKEHFDSPDDDEEERPRLEDRSHP